MPRKTHFTPSGKTLFFVLSSAALGQCFLAQADQPFTLWVGLLLYASSLWQLRKSLILPSPKPQSLSLSMEWILFSLILVLAFFLRIFRIDSLPSGMYVDQGFMGQRALLLLQEGWKPFADIFTFKASSYLLYFTSSALALWFRGFGASYLSFHFFYVLMSLAAFPFIYWVFRSLSGSRVALLALFLLAVMRWHIIFSRNGFPTIQVPFYSFVAIALWMDWLRNKKTASLLLSAFFCGVGLYTYQAFKVVPFLMLSYGLYEYSRQRRTPFFKSLGTYFLTLLLVASPLIACSWKESGIGYRENNLFLWKEVYEKKSLVPALDHWCQTALMFNRSGDTNPRHNLPGRRMLDDGTGLFFVLGLGFLWARRKEREGFYSLAGLAAMSLPCLLTVDPAHANRMLGITPWVAFTAAYGLNGLREKVERVLKPFPLRGLILPLVLTLVAAQNAYVYFVEQAVDERCWRENGVEQTFIGKTIARLEEGFPSRVVFFLTPAYFRNETVDFLTHQFQQDIFEFHLSDLAGGQIQKGKDAVFILEEGKSGVLDFLKTLFPGGKENVLKDFHQNPLVYLYAVPQESLSAFKGWKRGLKGVYAPLDKSIPPVTRVDPVLNFSFWKDFPLPPLAPFSVQWEGNLEIPSSGTYDFQVLTNHETRLFLDGRPVLDSSSGQPGSVKLLKGIHFIRVDYQKKDSIPAVFHLIWKPLGRENWEVVPATAFGRTR